MNNGINILNSLTAESVPQTAVPVIGGNQEDSHGFKMFLGLLGDFLGMTTEAANPLDIGYIPVRQESEFLTPPKNQKVSTLENSRDNSKRAVSEVLASLNLPLVGNNPAPVACTKDHFLSGILLDSGEPLQNGKIEEGLAATRKFSAAELNTDPLSNKSNSRLIPEMPLIVNEKMASENFISKLSLSAATSDNARSIQNQDFIQGGITVGLSNLPEKAAHIQASLLVECDLNLQYPVDKTAESFLTGLKPFERDLKGIKVYSFTKDISEQGDCDSETLTLKPIFLDDRMNFSAMRLLLSAKNSPGKNSEESIGNLERPDDSIKNVDKTSPKSPEVREVTDKNIYDTDDSVEASEAVCKDGKVIAGKELALDGRINHRLQHTEKPEINSVRLTAPSESDIRELKSGRTVIIKMEPEHMGPVRLTLSTSGDSLHGRMTVQSIEARAAVEGNLNELQEHLSRQGIKLDSFQISLAGGQVGQRAFSGRRSPADTGGASRHSTRILSHPISGLSENILNQRLYISATGVNWVA